jgi:hypothetical protein
MEKSKVKRKALKLIKTQVTSGQLVRSIGATERKTGSSRYPPQFPYISGLGYS